MNELKIFDNPEFGKIRTLEISGEAWFVGKDVAEILGYENSSRDINRHVDEEDRKIITSQNYQNGTFEVPTRGLIIINESGLYSLILASKLPTAKRFKHWITSEVLPSIRKYGSYNVSENPNVSLVTITPELAEELLKYNIGNRHINQANINRIAADMLTGNYKLNGETIKFYDTGELADGQHRLLAAVKAGVPFQTYIIRGIKKETLPTIDCGKSRNVADTLNMIGCHVQAKIIPAMNFYFNRGMKLTANQIQCLWEKYEDKFTVLCDILSGSHHDYILSQRDVRAFLIHLFISENWLESDVRSFVDGLKNKPTRETTHEMTGYYFRTWYDRKVHNKLHDSKVCGEKSKGNVTLDALCTVADGYKSNKIVKTFKWKNQSESVLQSGYTLAQSQFATLELKKSEV